MAPMAILSIQCCLVVCCLVGKQESNKSCGSFVQGRSPITARFSIGSSVFACRSMRSMPFGTKTMPYCVSLFLQSNMLLVWRSTEVDCAHDAAETDQAKLVPDKLGAKSVSHPIVVR